MAVIHQTTMSPTKLELLAAWLPSQPWYISTGQAPDLGRAGGFRLDDPQGEVGIEFTVVTDRSGDRARTYHVPMTYRGSALEAAEIALIGTSEHGVLGRRWIYDGAADPVLVAQLVALMQGEAQAQAQSVSNTPDMTVACAPVSRARLSVSDMQALSGDASGTEIVVQAVGAHDRAGELVIRIGRQLSPDSALPAPDDGRGNVTASWRQLDGTQVHGMLAETWTR